MTGPPVPHDHDPEWVRSFRPANPAAPVLVCFPHAGGAATAFFELARALSPAVAVLAVQYPARQDRHREPAISDLTGLVDGIERALTITPERPLALLGHSMGAIVAYELTRRIEAAPGAGVSRLFVSGRRAPSVQRIETVHLLDDRGMIEAAAGLGGTDRRVLEDEEMVALIVKSMRADYTAIETYRHVPGAPLRAPITALVGDRDPKTAAMAEVDEWRGHTAGAFDVETFPGDHFFLMRDPGPVAAAIRQRLLG